MSKQDSIHKKRQNVIVLYSVAPTVIITQQNAFRLANLHSVQIEYLKITHSNLPKSFEFIVLFFVLFEISAIKSRIKISFVTGNHVFENLSTKVAGYSH